MGMSGTRGRWKKNDEENAQTKKSISELMTTPPPKMGGVDPEKVTLAKRDWDQPSR